jgi:opacity protein-like surface antigen
MMAYARGTTPRIKGAVMRRLLVVVALLGLVSEACAGDFEIPDGMPTLRGSSPFVPAVPVYRRWAGFYFGGQMGYGNADVDFSRATQSLYGLMLRELAIENEQHVSTWQVLGKHATSGRSIGGFFGYNSQWDDLIVGFDAHYSNSNFFTTAPAYPIGRVTSAGGNSYDVVLNGSASIHITDWGAARMRAGYIVDNFLPYLSAGFAFGRADVSRYAQIDGTETTSATPPVVTPFSFSLTENKNNAWMAGWTVGAGVDVLLMPNLFARAEYEYVTFAAVAGIKPHINTGRVGVALKF